MKVPAQQGGCYCSEISFAARALFVMLSAKVESSDCVPCSTVYVKHDLRERQYAMLSQLYGYSISIVDVTVTRFR